MRLGQLLLNLAIVVNLAFLRINQQNLSWLQASLRNHVAGLKVHYANLRGYHHHTLLGDGVAAGAQSVAVQHTACVATIAKQQCGRTVPRLHQDRVIFVEGFQIF